MDCHLITSNELIPNDIIEPMLLKWVRNKKHTDDLVFFLCNAI